MQVYGIADSVTGALSIVAILSVASLAGGTVVSCLAERLPMRTARAELLGGLLLVVGLAILGCGLSPLVG